MSHTGWTPTSIDDLQRRTMQQARQALVPMKYYGGMDPNAPFLDRLTESMRQTLAAVPSKFPSFSSIGRVVPFATDAEREEEKGHPFEKVIRTDLGAATHLPDAILFGSSLGGGIPGWINAVKDGAFSAIGKQPTTSTPEPPTWNTPDPTRLMTAPSAATTRRFLPTL
jgi:hypothetical protein